MTNSLFNRRFAARAENLKQLREWVKAESLRHGMSEVRADQVVIGVNEACMNIIEHAYKNTPGDIILAISKQQDNLIFELTDFAQPMDCAKIKPRQLDDIRPGGLGVHFIQEIMDTVEYLPGDGQQGNRVRMQVKIDKG